MMRIAVDTNILFSFFWEQSLTKKLLISSGFELISPEIAIKELERYSGDIINKLNINKKDFYSKLKKLKLIVKFIKKEEYSKFLQQAGKISPDKDDAEFLALCMKYSCFLWSNDSALKQQDKIKVLSTEEIIEIMF